MSATERETARPCGPTDGTDAVVHPLGMRNRAGLTLIEIMFVTLIIGIIVAIAAGPLGKARERAMVGAVKGDIRNVEGEIDRYVTVNGYWPESVDDLEDYDSGPDILYCSFTLNEAARAVDNTVSLSAIHRNSTTIVSATTPGGQMTEATAKTASGCKAKKTKAPKAPKPPKKP